MENKMTICYAEKRGADDNNKYPYKQVVTCLDDLLKATAYDHVCAVYKGNARSGDNFIESTCLVMDCDNAPKKPSDPDIPPEDWKTPEDVADAFPGVDFYIVYSRNNQKPKGNRPPRPKFHVYFPISQMTSFGDYAKLKRRIQRYFPAFDSNALDAARFFYGVENPQGEYFEGLFNVDDIIDILDLDASESGGESAEAVPDNTVPTNEDASIQKKSDRAGNAATSRPKFGEPLYEGNRNSGLHKIALSLLTKYGHDDSQAYDLFMQEADCCQPSLEDKEISTIWHSAVDYYNKQIKTKPDYVTPKQYALRQLEIKPIPSDFSDVGQASLLAEIYSEKLRYTTATKWLVYDGQKWNEDELQAQALAQELTEKQLEYAKDLVRQAQKAENEAAESDKDASDESKSLKFAKDFRKFVMMERRSPRIAAALTETRPKVAIKMEDLDSDPFLLNTPAGTVDLRTGEMRPHNPLDYCTKITAVSPSMEGMDIYKDFLWKLTCGDKDMELYLQKTSGMELIGKVFSENMEMAYGGGGNGKSSYYDSKQTSLGDYASSISAKLLTVSYNQNKKPEIAELRGKRFVIAAELDEDQRLDTAVLKQLCSTGKIIGEKSTRTRLILNRRIHWLCTPTIFPKSAQKIREPGTVLWSSRSTRISVG